MKKKVFLLLTMSLTTWGLQIHSQTNELSKEKKAAAGNNIIADHTVVSQYQSIPQTYIDKVKQMWFDLPGESHSFGYRKGLLLLQTANSRYAVNVLEDGEPEKQTSAHLRASKASWGDINSTAGWRYGYGEEDWYTNQTAIARTKAHIDYCASQNLGLSALGFGWCWDLTWHNDPGGTVDPVYGIHWAGSSDTGPQGDKIWGLDKLDSTLTGNSVCMDTYLNATQAYADYCTSKGYSTKVFFTTGPVDGYDGESGYQRQIKHDYIRTFVKANANRILFDYADILAWSDAGAQNLQTFKVNGVDHTYQMIHSDNMLDLNGGYNDDGDHIGERGALRLGKAVWWMLARIAGWDGVSVNVEQAEASDNSKFSLKQNYPNPFTSATTIEYTLPVKEFVKLSVYDMLGKEVKVLVNEVQIAGKHNIIFTLDGLPMGIYYYRLETDNFCLTRKMLRSN